MKQTRPGGVFLPMMHRLLSVFSLAALFCSLTIAASAAPVPKGGRTLGISVGPAEDGDYGRAFDQARSAGMQSVTLSQDWSGLETAPGHYHNEFLTIADNYYPARGITVDLILRPLNTNRVEVPVDLTGNAFDDPAVIARFERLLDDVFAQTSHLTLGTLTIGNEVDDFLGSDPALWKQYRTFYETVGAYARTKRPGLRVGVAATFRGLTGMARKRLLELNGKSDVVIATYYPLNTDFTVKDASVVGPDFDTLCRLYPNRPIVFTEVGYPSSPDCGSSDAKQADCVRSVFAAWDAHAGQIISLTWSWLTDLSPSSVAGLDKYYGVSTRPFAEFLRTLGLRTFPGQGQDKPAFLALKTETQARGW